MTNCTVVVSTYKRPLELDRCLKSVLSLRAKIVIVSSGKDLETLLVAKKYNATHVDCENNLMLNINKNYGFTKVTTDWILNLDDDEELTKDLVFEVSKVLHANNPAISGYWIPRKNIIFGTWIRHGVWWPDPQLRLFRKGKGRFPQKHVHEYLHVNGQTETLDESFIHHNYHSVEQFLYKMEHIYTVSEVERLTSSGYKVIWYDALRFPLRDFVKVYFAQRGYKDGLHGLVLSLLQGFYMFIVFVKLWEKEGFREKEIKLFDVTDELSCQGKDVSYWMLTSKMRDASNPIRSLWYQLKRRITRMYPL